MTMLSLRSKLNLQLQQWQELFVLSVSTGWPPGALDEWRCTAALTDEVTGNYERALIKVVALEPTTRPTHYGCVENRLATNYVGLFTCKFVNKTMDDLEYSCQAPKVFSWAVKQWSATSWRFVAFVCEMYRILVKKCNLYTDIKLCAEPWSGWTFWAEETLNWFFYWTRCTISSIIIFWAHLSFFHCCFEYLTTEYIMHPTACVTLR